MEKVEKLLLLVVLGAAMVIMAVMSFGSGDPEKPGQNPGDMQADVRNAPADVGGTPLDPNSDENSARIDKQGQDQRTLDQRTLDERTLEELKVHDGPDLIKKGGQGPLVDPLAKNHPLPKSPDSSKSVDVLEGPGSILSPADLKTDKVITAEVSLEPGDEPGILIYTVQPNDSLSGISEKLTGSTQNVGEIIAGWNEGMDRNVIVPGQKIQIPESMLKGRSTPNAKSRASMNTSRRMPVPGTIRAPSATPVPASARTSRKAVPERAPARRAPATEGYTIRKGETLWAIAKRRVGERKANAYVRQIQDLNPGLDPAGLQPKDTILLPAR